MYTSLFFHRTSLVCQRASRVSCLIMACALLSCAQHFTPSTPSSEMNGAVPVLSVNRLPRDTSVRAPSDSISAFIAELKTLGGQYVPSPYVPLVWEFSKDQAPVFRRIVAVGDAAIAPLVQCIGNSSPTQTKIQRRFIPLGVLCYDALNRMIYHEETSATGDMDPDWAGYITPEATPSDLRRGQQAWQQVIRSGTYKHN